MNILKIEEVDSRPPPVRVVPDPVDEESFLEFKDFQASSFCKEGLI